MNRIVRKKRPAEGVIDLTVEAPVIAKKHRAGQFVIVRGHDHGERIPLTLVDSDPEAGTIRLIIQAIGKSTTELGELAEGDALLDIAGPLGEPTHIEKVGRVVCIGGGIGVAPVHPIAKAMKAAGNEVISITGAKTSDLIIMEEEMNAISDELILATDDGSRGLHGFVTTALDQLIERDGNPDLVVAIGPVVMMRAVSELTRPRAIPTMVSLNSIMVDGTGMCGGCRVQIGDKTKFVCVDGPEFDGHLVDFDGLMLRQRAYLEQEAEAMQRYHRCRLDGVALEGGSR